METERSLLPFYEKAQTFAEYPGFNDDLSSNDIMAHVLHCDTHVFNNKFHFFSRTKKILSA